MNSSRITYTRDQLLELRLVDSKPAAEARSVIRGLIPRRGCRAGSHLHRYHLRDASPGQIPVVNCVTRLSSCRQSLRCEIRSPPARQTRVVNNLILVAPPKRRRRDRSDATIQFGLLNTRSAVSKAALLHDVISDNHLDVLCVTETWIPADAPNAVKLDIAPPHYQVIHRHRIGKPGGGVAVIHRETVRATEYDIGWSTDQFEFLIVKLASRSSSLIVVCIYRPPGHVSAALCDALADLLDRLLESCLKFVLCGDLNTPGEESLQIDTKIAQLLVDYNLEQRVTEPTHDHGHVLDVIITGEGDAKQVSDVCVQDVCFTDHRLVTCRLNQPINRQDTVTHTYRNIKKVDMSTFRSDLTMSLPPDSLTSVDEYVTTLHASMTDIIDRHAPLHTITRRAGQHEGLPLSQEARQAKRVRRQLERRYHRTGSVSDRRAYRAANLAARTAITKSRADIIYSQLFRIAGDQRALWRTSQRLLHSRPPIYYSDDECSSLVNVFGEFFTDKLSRISDSISTSLDSVPSITPTVRTHNGPLLTEFSPVTSLDVYRIITKMNSKTSPLDRIPAGAIKECADLFAPAIARLANLSFEEGRFPLEFKVAQVMPLLKKPGLDKKAPENYRPISNLSTISKILERLVLAQLRPHLLGSQNYNPLQSAYRAGHSTETALLSVLDDVYTAGEDKKFTIVIGLDMSLN